MADLELHPDDVVVIGAFDDIPEHRFRIAYVFEDCVGGYSLTGLNRAGFAGGSNS